MGMVIFGALALAVVGGGMLGAIALLIHFFANRKGYGSWKSYLIISAVVTLVVGVSAVMWMFSSDDVPGAPTADEYNRWIFGAALLGGSPGVGLLAGLLSLLKGREPASPAAPVGGQP
ncbi:hypothetical protein A176_002607 [Myxococcus hansupus]|uniref:Uncharacterized protein n=1 Tax=Pseudomyxococcus hansupus TaxID=1297742 RepID=A0A0H4WWH9_9BACT|nr:hypothetical protein [Myxococcus hansupus]AKQ65695.1 hypothetical protein A176_002607 [Myxococcus hansupus]